MIRKPKQENQSGESGQSFIVMLLVILPLLILILGVTYDLGNVAAGVTVAQNAADLAAHEAAKLVDVAHYVRWEEVRLRPLAPAVAQDVADEMTGGAFRVTGVYVEERVILVEGEVAVRTPFLGAFLGIRSVTRPVQGVAEAAYGIEGGGGE